MNLGKKVFQNLYQIGSGGFQRSSTAVMADVVEMAVSVLQVSSVLWKRIHLLSHSGEFTMTHWGVP